MFFMKSTLSKLNSVKGLKPKVAKMSQLQMMNESLKAKVLFNEFIEIID